MNTNTNMAITNFNEHRIKFHQNSEIFNNFELSPCLWRHQLVHKKQCLIILKRKSGTVLMLIIVGTCAK